MYKIQTLNAISDIIYTQLSADKYTVSKDEPVPDAILVRSAAMHDMEFGKDLLAIGRAGAGVNNIPIPTCILMPDDYTAVNTIRILNEEGFSTPEQFSCAGYDGIPLSQAVSPRVTTFSQDTETIGRKAVEILIRAMQEGPGLNREITVRGKLIPGETVAAVG